MVDLSSLSAKEIVAGGIVEALGNALLHRNDIRLADDMSLVVMFAIMNKMSEDELIQYGNESINKLKLLTNSTKDLTDFTADFTTRLRKSYQVITLAMLEFDTGTDTVQ